MIRASIDIGSNSVLLLIVELSDDNQRAKEHENHSIVTGLGREIDKNGHFLQEALDDTTNALDRYLKIIKTYDIAPIDVLVTATEASRVASNSRDFFMNIKSLLGFNIQIISSAGEAYYTGLGVSLGLGQNTKTITIMDMGGASTELIKIKTSPFSLIDTISLPVGSVRATEWVEQRNYIDQFNLIKSSYSIQDYISSEIVCVAGSMTSIAAMFKKLSDYDDKSVHNTSITLDEFRTFYNVISSQDSNQLQKSFPYLKKRSRTIVAGARVALDLFIALNCNDLDISTLGLRNGIVYAGEISPKYIIA